MEEERQMQSQPIETPRAAEVRPYGMLIGSEGVGAGFGKAFESIDPHAGRVWARVSGAEDQGVVAT
jgi:hypothetical protein